jgi:hypothetical protein
MKKSLVVLAVVALLLASAVPALAAGGKPAAPAAQFTLAGKITAVEGSTVSVYVVGGNPMVHPSIEMELPIQTTDSTRFLLKTDTGTVVISLADLAIDQNVSVQGNVVDGVWTASRLTVGAELIHW